MKIGFVVLQNVVKDIVASTRIRVYWPAQYDPDFIVTEEFSLLRQCDVVVFQTRIDNPDVERAKKLKALGSKIIFDFTDPHWLKEYDPQAIHPVFNKIVDVADMITLSTEELQRTFTEAFPEAKTAVILDKIDLSIYNKTKVHRNSEEHIITWHGSYGNISSLELARSDLERLGLEHKIKLICVYDRTTEFKVHSFNNIELEIREWSNQEVIDSLLQADVSINPKYINHWKSYKSDNKTVTAWALGIPCVEDDFYKYIKVLLSNPNLRNQEGLVRRKIVERNYNVRETARQWKGLAQVLTNFTSKQNKITVYTAICGGFDGLREDQNVYGTADYIAFMDTYAKSNVWYIKNMYRTALEPCRQAKIYKILPWHYLNCEYSIWMDATIALRVDPQVLIDKFLISHDIAIFKHIRHQDIYVEYQADLVAHTTEPLEIKEKMINECKKQQIPNDTGIWECGLIVRRHTEQVKRLCETWWATISAYTTSDLIPFVYSLRYHDIEINPITPGTIYDNPYVEYVLHPETKNRILK